MLWQLLLTTFLIMILSLTGVIFFSRFEKIQQKISYLVSISIGAFLAVVFFDLVPEAFELNPEHAPIFILGGFFIFLLFSHTASLYHHHHDHLCSHEHSHAGSMVLLGDAVHNIIDGIVIATAFAVDTTLGIATAIGIAAHELPQEIAEFFVLTHAGYSKIRALLFNFFISGTIIIGALIGYVSIQISEFFMAPLIGIAAGNLLYLASSDLLPNIIGNKMGRGTSKEFLIHFLMILFGAILISLILVTIGHEHA